MTPAAEGRLVIGGPKPEATDAEAGLERALRTLQESLWRHPIAIQAAYSALLREGRKFAQTDEGKRLLDGLSRSPALAKTRMAWEVLSLSAFVEKPDAALPSVFSEALVRAIKVTAIEPVLSRLFERRRQR